MDFFISNSFISRLRTHTRLLGPLLLGLAVTLAIVFSVSLHPSSPALSAPSVMSNDGPLSTTAAPTVTLSTYYGGSTQECPFHPCAVAVDDDGNIYVAGTTYSDDFPLTNPYTTTFSGGSGADIFLLKLAAGTHAILYSTYLAPGIAQGVAVNSSGEVYVTGRTSSSAFPTTPNAVQPIYQGGVDAYVAQLSADGSQLLYGSYLGGGSWDEGFDIAVDDAGNIYLTGWTSSDDFDTANAHQAALGGDDDAFVTKIAADGSLSYSTYMGGSNNDEGWGIALDNAGNAYVTGRSSSDNFETTPGVVQPDRFSGAGSDAIVVKMAASGALDYSTFFNTTSTNAGVDIAVDDMGNTYVISTHEGVFKLNADASAIAYQSEFDIETNVGGEGGIAVDSDGIAYVTGWRGSGIDQNIVLAVLAENGYPILYESFGGSDTDHGYSIAVHEDGSGHKNVTIVGDSSSDDFPTVNPLQAQLNGSKDAYILHLIGMEDLPQYFLYIPLTVR